VPVVAQYAVNARIAGEQPNQNRCGMLLLEARTESLMARTRRQVLKVLVREAGASPL